MKYKGILLDIDNTLYNYKDTHNKAFEKLIEKTATKTSIPKSKISSAYLEARSQIQGELPNTASSHNRLLYIQRMLELLNVNVFKYSLMLYDTYWNTFLDSIQLYNNVISFLESQNNIPICFLTDLTAHIQHRKIEKLSIAKHTDYLVTSEEAGLEKPHAYMFMLAMKKMNLHANEICMIGDNYEKDIIGANSLGIASYWLNKSNKSKTINNKNIIEFYNFKELGELMK